MGEQYHQGAEPRPIPYNPNQLTLAAPSPAVPVAIPQPTLEPPKSVDNIVRYLIRGMSHVMFQLFPI